MHIPHAVIGREDLDHEIGRSWPEGIYGLLFWEVLICDERIVWRPHRIGIAFQEKASFGSKTTSEIVPTNRGSDKMFHVVNDNSVPPSRRRRDAKVSCNKFIAFTHSCRQGT